MVAPFPNDCRLGFVKAGSPQTRTLSSPSNLSTVPHFNSHPKRGRSMAPRSRQVMLSCPSSLPGHSDFPTPITSILPVSPDLLAAYRRWSPAETLGSQVFPPLSVTACHRPYSGSLPGAYALCFPDSIGLLPHSRGSACIFTSREVYPTIELSQLLPFDHSLTKLHRSFYATACRLTLRLSKGGFGTHPWLGKTRISCEPPRYCVGASSARVSPHEPAPSLLI